jgi:hypothetical protein
VAKVQLYVTSNALAAVAAGTTTRQINVRGLEHKGGSNKNPLTLTVDLKVNGSVRPVQFILRDTNGIHPSHQVGEALEIWDRLYDALSKTPGRPLITEGVVSEDTSSGVEIDL